MTADVRWFALGLFPLYFGFFFWVVLFFLDWVPFWRLCLLVSQRFGWVLQFLAAVKKFFTTTSFGFLAGIALVLMAMAVPL